MNMSYRLVNYHDTERKAEIIQVTPGESPEGYSSMSRGFETEEELRKHENIPDSTCSCCDSIYSSNYSTMRDDGTCFSCQFWIDKKITDRVVITNDTYYVIGPKSTHPNEFRGFAGRDFYIQFDDGRLESTTNLWHAGKIPERFRDRLKNNAKMISKAEFANLKEVYDETQT
jgi:hypothetical protein